LVKNKIQLGIDKVKLGKTQFLTSEVKCM